MNLSKDCYSILVNYLKPMDIVNLSRANPKVGKWLYPLFMKRLTNLIDASLKEHFDLYGKIKGGGGTYEQFVEAMKKSKAMITDSFIIQIIKDEYYGTPIDIYIQDDIIEYFDPILRYNHSTIGSIDINRPRIVMELNVEYEFTHHAGLLSEKFISFRIITVETDVEYYIRNYIDFNILKNWFYYDSRGPHIEITSLNDILNNKIRFNREKYIEKTGVHRDYIGRRIKKYRERGFKFI